MALTFISRAALWQSGICSGARVLSSRLDSMSCRKFTGRNWQRPLRRQHKSTCHDGFHSCFTGINLSRFTPAATNLEMVLTRNNLEWWCERGILFLVLGMLVFAPLAFGAVDAWAFLVVQGTAAVVFVLWAARLWLGRSRKSKILWPPLAWVVLAFTVYAVVRYFTADIEYVARLEFIQVLMFALLFFVIVNVLRGQEETDMVSFTLIAVATFISCYAVAQLLAHSDQVW